MARGWESKAVEDQMQEQDAKLRGAETAAPQYEISPAVRARNERLESLRLSHSRTDQQLARATNDRHREMLKRALSSLEKEIEELS
jgi:replication-associated recombination protein RarA